MDWIVPVVWLVGWLLAVYPLATATARYFDDPVEAPDILMAVLFGAFWPVLLAGSVAWLASRRIWSRILDEREEATTDA